MSFRVIAARFVTIFGAFAIVTSGLFNGIYFTGENTLITLLLAGLIFTVIQLFIKPIVVLFTCPIMLLSLGLVGFFVSLAVLYATALLTATLNTGGQLVIESLGWGILASIIMGILDSALEYLLGRQRDRRIVEVTEVRTVIEDRRGQADAQFNALIADDDKDDFDVIDPNTGRPR